MNLIDALYSLLRAYNELPVENTDDLLDLDIAIDNLCKVLGLTRKYLEQGCYSLTRSAICNTVMLESASMISSWVMSFFFLFCVTAWSRAPEGMCLRLRGNEEQFHLRRFYNTAV